MKKTNKGITLIALIITIIVMLILVAVSIRIVITSGLFESAKVASRKTEAAYRDEGTLGSSININGKIYNSVEEHTQSIKAENPIEECTTHEWGEWETVTEATCTIAGIKKRSCTVCKKNEIENIAVLEHSYDPSTGTCTECSTECSHSWNTETGNCPICNSTCSHSYGEWQTTTEATCTAEGSKKRICTTCGKEETQSIEALEHNYSGGICTRCGETEPVQVTLGDYIKYDVAYTDAYKSYDYTETNGWRLLHATQNPDGTYRDVELISTGIPAKFYYRYDTAGSWWETNTSTLNTFKNLLGGSNYNFYTGTSDYVALKAAAGFYYYFGDLPFTLTDSPSVNNGGCKLIRNSDRKTGTTAGTGARLFLTSKAASVRLLTLKELNEARGITNDPDNTGSISAAQDPTGLYYLGNLKSVSGIGSTNYDAGDYWLASPYPGDRENLPIVVYTGDMDFGISVGTRGVRPVVIISRI